MRRPQSLRGLLRPSEGAQLVEFALAVPFLVVMLVGILDFGQAFNLKQKLTNAAREGARIAISQPQGDLNCTSCSCPSTGSASPCTVKAVRDAVVNYMTNAGLDTSFIPSDPIMTAPYEWTYYSTVNGAPVLTIHRGMTVLRPDGTLIVATRVALGYPHTWSFGQVVDLLSSSASFANSFVISTEVIMENLT